MQDLLKALNKELVDLVNDNYTDFISLGEKLKGGEDRVEEIRIGLLGFQRDVTGVRNLIDQRSNDVKQLLNEKRNVRKQIRFGRNLLEIEERLQDLEERLGISMSKPEPTTLESVNDGADLLTTHFDEWPDHWIEDYQEINYSTDEDSETGHDIPTRLTSNLQSLQVIQMLRQKCGEQQPYVLSQRDRLSVIRNALSKNLESAIRGQPDVKVKQKMIQMKNMLEEE